MQHSLRGWHGVKVRDRVAVRRGSAAGDGDLGRMRSQVGANTSLMDAVA